MRARTESSPWNGRRQKQLCVTLDDQTLREIDKAAADEGLTRSQMVREFIEWGLENRA
jgi:metal-responsive CopG/Arc/MetJ family transcriptional regulator